MKGYFVKNFFLQLSMIMVTCFLGANAFAQQQEMVVSATFDHGYVLRVQGCNVSWTYDAGARGISGENQSGCMGQSNVRISVDYPSRIDHLELPSPRNAYTLTALVVEPLGGANQVVVRISSYGNVGGGGGSGYGQIYAARSYCASNFCTYNFTWRTANGGSSVLTVERPDQSSQEILETCAGSASSTRATWIVPGKSYILRVYESRSCIADIGRYQRPVAELNFIGGQ